MANAMIGIEFYVEIVGLWLKITVENLYLWLNNLKIYLELTSGREIVNYRAAY